MELNDIQEMTLADIEKTLAGNEKRILSNLSRAQKLLEENVQKLMDESKQLITESTVLNQYKTKKMLEETKARMFAQFESVKGLDVATLFAPPEKAKSEKSGKSKNHKNANLEKSPDAENSENQKSGKSQNRENANLEKSPDAKISENANLEKSKIGNSENLEIGNSENLKIEKSENQNSENAENRKSDYDPEMIEGLKKIATVLGLPEDSSVIEIRRAFETNKNSLPLFVQNKYEKILRKFEKE